MRLFASCAASLILVQAANKGRHSPFLLWSSNPKLFTNDEVIKRTLAHEVFETLLEALDAAPEVSTPYLIIHMLPRGIESSTILDAESMEASPPKVLTAEVGSHLLFRDVAKPKDFDLTQEWADLYEKLHIPQHQQDKKRLAILTNRDVQEDEEAYRVALPDTTFVFDQVAEKMGDTRILLVEGGALLQANGNDASHWSIISALLGNTKSDVLLVSADIDPPLPKKSASRKRERAALRRLQSDPDADDTQVVLRVKPGQLAILLYIAAFVFTVIVAVICTMQITTPALYLDKAIPINKEF